MSGSTKARVAALTGALLAIAFGLHLAGVGAWRDGLLVLSSVVAGIPIAISAVQALRYRAFSIDLLVTIAVIGALIIGEYVEAAVVSFLFIFGAYLEARTLEKTRSSLRELVDMAPQQATVIRDGETLTIPVDDVVVGDRVVVHSGGTIPVDGVISSGRGLVNEAAITGEPLPASKADGASVYSGSILDTGFIELVAERVGEDTTFSQIIELVEEAQDAKTRAQRFLDRFANIYTPGIVVLSILVFALTGNAELALTFLVIACPGALVISVPVSMVAGLGNGARHGVLMKGGDALERLSKVQVLVFDKTGTLTMGRPQVTDVAARGGLDTARLLALAAGLEQASEHPLGRTIVEHARDEHGLPLVDAPSDVEVIPGGGIRGTVDGHDVAVGSRRVLAALDVEIADTDEAWAVEREQGGSTAVFVTVDGSLAGVVAITDQIRPEVPAAIRMLRERGIREFHMLTGDNRHTAALVAARLGIDHVKAELLPQDKVRVVSQLRERGLRVGMIGDGINDAPAIATADVGIAMGAGTDVSIQTADVILMGNRFDQLVHAVSLARATVRNMKQNTTVALVTVAALLAGVLLGAVFMSTGMLVHEASVLAVVLNAVRLVRYRDRRLADTRTPTPAVTPTPVAT